MRPPQEVQAEIDPLAAAVAGLAGGAAFVAVLEADIRLTGNNVDDLIVLGRPFVRGVGEARKIGLLFHVANSVLLAGLYAKLEPHLPGPPWLKGVIFANVENLMLYPSPYLKTFTRQSRSARSTATSPGPASCSQSPAT